MNKNSVLKRGIMIQKIQTDHCRNCQSANIVKKGHNACGNPQYKGKDCGVHRVLNPEQKYSKARKEEILRAYPERSSLRGVCRIFGVSYGTLTRGLKKKLSHLPPVSQTLQSDQPGDVLELDELWSFIAKRKNQVGLWTALCRRTRQIIAFVNKTKKILKTLGIKKFLEQFNY